MNVSVVSSLSGENSRKLLEGLTRKEREVFFDDVKQIYHGIVRYFQLNLPLKNSFLHDCDQIVRVARAVPWLLNASEIDR